MVRVTVTQQAESIIESEGLHDKYDAWQKVIRGLPGHRPRRPGWRRGCGSRGGGRRGRGRSWRGPNPTRRRHYRPGSIPGFGRGNPPGPGGGFGAGGRGPGRGAHSARHKSNAFCSIRPIRKPLPATRIWPPFARPSPPCRINPGGFQGENLAMVFDHNGHARCSAASSRKPRPKRWQ